MKGAARQTLDDYDSRGSFEINILDSVNDLICRETQRDKNRDNCSHLKLMRRCQRFQWVFEEFRVLELSLCCSGPSMSSCQRDSLHECSVVSPSFNRCDVI